MSSDDLEVKEILRHYKKAKVKSGQISENELNSNCPCGSGERYRDCCYPDHLEESVLDSEFAKESRDKASTMQKGMTYNLDKKEKKRLGEFKKEHLGGYK